ncbi:MAG: thiamine-phosphate pyrophosphorylase [Candidatus Omnitrophica bacterium]|nr:thiamine-phosphate pyrophosphorylase [Candidatus Omnitrophota bacterium]
MPRDFKKINRIIDANINRAKEGLRVCEEIARFILNNRSLVFGFRRLRHKIDTLTKDLPQSKVLISERESLKDIGKDIHTYELRRKDINDVFFANIQRAKESIRVLEEFSKLINKDIPLRFKKIRYAIYEIEKRMLLHL